MTEIKNFISMIFFMLGYNKFDMVIIVLNDDIVLSLFLSLNNHSALMIGLIANILNMVLFQYKRHLIAYIMVTQCPRKSIADLTSIQCKNSLFLC